MASGSRKDPDWMTRMGYLSSTATPSALRILVKTSAWSRDSPPSLRV
jgi:hypothetical protein